MTDYCVVCENKGFTHGLCPTCKRAPKVYVTTIDGEQPQSPYDDEELSWDSTHINFDGTEYGWWAWKIPVPDEDSGG